MSILLPATAHRIIRLIRVIRVQKFASYALTVNTRKYSSRKKVI